MESPKLIISPKTKVGELLDTYPQLENVLLELSPSFSKLKNPILRKTVARVASLQQAAIVGGLKVDELVNLLRQEVGQDKFSGEAENSQYISSTIPNGFDVSKVKRHFDATPVINSGGSPMNDILAISHELQPGEYLELKTPFVPAPIIDMLKNKGFQIFSIRKEEVVLSYIVK